MKNIKVMLPNTEIPDLTSLKYPCYIQPLPKGERFIYVPGVGISNIKGKLPTMGTEEERVNILESLSSVGTVVLEGYLGMSLPDSDDSKAHSALLRAYLMDCLPIEDFMDKSCDLRYSQRLENIRYINNEQIYDYSRIIDIETNSCNSPSEVVDLYKLYLEEGYAGIRIVSKDGKYCFGTSANQELYELRPLTSKE